MKIMKNIRDFVGKVIILLIAIGIVGIIFARLGIGRSASSDVAPTQAAADTTGRNSFISGCKGQNTTEAYCGCAYDKLLAMYPDLVTNQDRIHRIVTEGYNSTETDAMVPCFTSPTVLSN